MRVLKLNVTYEYLSVEPWEDVIHLVMNDRARVVETYEGKTLRSPTEEWDFPAVIIMKEYVDTKKRERAFAPTKRNVLIRDNFQCQYCGCRLTNGTGTKDHVIPASKGGPTKMSNLVASCKSCNSIKDDRTCAQANMYPRTAPRSLSEEEKLKSVLKTYKTKEKEVWFRFLKDNGIKLW